MEDVTGTQKRNLSSSGNGSILIKHMISHVNQYIFVEDMASPVGNHSRNASLTPMQNQTLVLDSDQTGKSCAEGFNIPLLSWYY